MYKTYIIKSKNIYKLSSLYEEWIKTNKFIKIKDVTTLKDEIIIITYIEEEIYG